MSQDKCPQANESKVVSSNQVTSSLFQPRFLNVDAVIKGSIQKAVVQLEDKRDNSQRPRERLKIVHNLLFHPQNRGKTEQRELEGAHCCR